MSNVQPNSDDWRHPINNDRSLNRNESPYSNNTSPKNQQLIGI